MLPTRSSDETVMELREKILSEGTQTAEVSLNVRADKQSVN